MVEKKPVNINWQTVFVFIPLVWIWAFYRIDKLGKGLALILGTSAAIGFALGIGEGLAGVPEDEYLIEEIILLYAIITPVGIFFMRKWSKEWNRKILQDHLN